MELAAVVRPIAITEGALRIELEALVEEHKRMVFRIGFSLLRNRHDAEDAAQETFLRVWRNADKLAGIDNAKAWIARIAWNAATDRLRGTAAAAEVPLEDLAGGVRRLHTQGASAEEIARGNEMQRLLGGLIAALPPKLREVMQLSTVEDLEPAEIAQMLGIAPANVRWRMFQARAILREKLERIVGRQS